MVIFKTTPNLNSTSKLAILVSNLILKILLSGDLIDFGAGRDYDTSFLGHYLEIIHGAYTSDRKKIIDSSLQMKMLTGEENREMTDTHY